MAKTIGKRWKELPAAELQKFKSLAEDDTERYRKEMEAYNHELGVKGRRESEEMSRKRMEEAQVRGGLPSTGMAPNAPNLSQQSALPMNPDDLGQLAGSHLLNRISRNPAAPVSNTVTGSSVSAQFNQIIQGSALPNLQGLRGLLSASRQSNGSLQGTIIGGQQPKTTTQASLENQIRQNQARLEDQLRKQQQSQLAGHIRQQQQQQEQLRQNLMNQMGANPGFISSLPPGLQRQLLLQSLRGNLSSGSGSGQRP